MKHSSARVWIALLLAFVSQPIAYQGVLAQGPELQERSRARVVLRDPNVAPFEGSVIETWADGFAIDVRGEPTPRRVEFAEVESLQRSLRLGTRAGRGAILGGGVAGVTGFIFGYCFQIFAEGCAEDFRTGVAAGLVAGAGGALVGAGIGWMITRYGPWETVADLGGSGRSGTLDRLSVELLPYPDGRIRLGVSLALGGG